MIIFVNIDRIVDVKRIIRKYKNEGATTMRYVILVSHGKFANGLMMLYLCWQEIEKISYLLALKMEKRRWIYSIIHWKVKDISTDDEVILLGDIIGGSPLTNATNVLVNKGIKTVILGGMNLPLALTTVLMKDTVSLDEIADQVLEQARMAMQEFKIVEESEEDI